MSNFGKIGINTQAVADINDPNNKYFNSLSRLGLVNDAYFDNNDNVWKGRMV